jgi:chlorite dismutase
VSERPNILSVPETLEGWAVLHEIYRIDWADWMKRSASDHQKALEQAIGFLKQAGDPPEGATAVFSLLGHKGNLLILHFRRALDELNDVSLKFQRLMISSSLRMTQSYVSYVELGMYEMTVKLQKEFLAAGLKPETDDWNARWKKAMDEQRERMKARIYPEIRGDRYFCFTPRHTRRGEVKNWYAVPMEARQDMMRDHGMIGRKYSGQVTQVITGSIGFDDWEWGVYLFAKDPVVFKRLIYEMRFDEASAAYAVFGPFYTGLQFNPDGLTDLMNGRVPAFHIS